MRDVISSARRVALALVKQTSIEQLEFSHMNYPFRFSHDVRYAVMRELYVHQAEQLAVLQERVRRLEAK